MDKQQIISFIEGQLAAGKITREDLSAIGTTTVQKKGTAEESSKNLIHTFYAIGAIIAVIGVTILIAQHWSEMGFAGRLLVTLGISAATYIAAFFVSKPEQRILSQVFFTISAALAPISAYVLLHEANVVLTFEYQIGTALILGVIYGTALLTSKKNILVLITLGFFTWAYFALVVKIVGLSMFSSDLFKTASMILGASYLLIAYGYSSFMLSADADDAREKRGVQNVLYAAGTLTILGVGITIGGSFDLIYIAFIFAAFYASVYLKNRMILIFGAMFLVGHMIKLTSKYFANSVGWPVALIVVGFLVIGIGYFTFYLNKKYIKNTTGS